MTAAIQLNKEHRDILETLISMEAAGTLDRQCFSDLPIQVYHSPICPGISSTAIKTIVKSSISQWQKSTFTGSRATRFGNAFHTYVNEPNLFSETYEITQSRQKLFHREKIPLLDSDFQLIIKMQKKLYQHPDASIILNGAQFEHSYFSRDSETGILKKCRLDAKNGDTMGDLKTCEDASESAFTYDCKKYLYRISAAYYLEVTGEVIGKVLSDFRLIACEKKESNDINVFTVSQRSLNQGSEEIRRTLRSLQTYKEQNGQTWTGYPLGAKEILI